MNCRWKGNCTAVDKECKPLKETDCQYSMECAMFRKCFLSFSEGGCITAEERNEEMGAIIRMGDDEED
jgi:hypothetical protein